MLARNGILSKSPFKVATIFTDDFASKSLSNYAVNVGAGNIMINQASRLVMSGASGGITSNIQYNASSSPHQYTMLEKWKQRVTFIAQTPGANTFGFSIGVFAQGSYTKVHNYVRLAADTGGGLGSFYVYSNVNGSIAQTTNGSFTLVGGTTYVFEVERNKNQITARLFAADGVTQVRSSYTYTYGITSQQFTQIGANVGRFCLINHGGTNTILKWEVSSDAKRNTDYVGVAASLGYGMFAGSNAARYLENGFTDAGKTFEIMSGYDQGLGECDLYKKEVVRMNPRWAHINPIANDISHSVSSGVWQANYAAYVTYLKNAGIRVNHGAPVARTGFDMSGALSYLNTNYSADGVVDYFSLTKDPSNTNLKSAYNIGDGVHMNSTGHGDCGDLLAAFL